MPQRERDIDVLARTIWGEARGEGIAGQIAVGWCIRNRVEMDLHNDGRPDWWGEGYEGVCRAPWQFSCWNKNDPNFPYLVGQKLIPAGQFLQCGAGQGDGERLAHAQQHGASSTPGMEPTPASTVMMNALTVR